MKFKAPIKVESSLVDSSNSSGSAGQVLTSTGAGVDWIDPTLLPAESAEKVIQTVRMGEAVSKGDPLVITGYHGSNGPAIVERADATNSTYMPAYGVALEDYAINATGLMIAVGDFDDFDTSGYSVGDTLYVAVGGGMTNVKPTGTGLIQNMGIVSRSNANNGSVEIIAIGRTNDVPNLPEGRLFVGTSGNTSLTSDVVYIDDTNSNVGIGTSSPSTYFTLDVNGSANFSSDIQVGRNATALSFDMNPGYDSGAYYLSLCKNQTNDGGIILKSKPTSGSAQNDWQIVNQGTTGDLKFYAYGLAGNALILDRETGNLQLPEYGAGTLVSDASGNITVSSGGGAGGPYLPLAAGSSYPLTGVLYLGNVGSDQKIQFQRTGGNVYSIEHDSAQLYFYNRTSTEAPLVIQNDGDVLMNAGNVGIGTTDPTTHKLIVSGGSHIASFRSEGSGQNLKKLSISTGGDRVVLDASTTTDTTTDFAFQTGGVERMRINAQGVVSISNDTPTFVLQNSDTSLIANQTIGDINFSQSDPSGDGVGVVSKIRSINNSSFQGYAGLAFHTGTATTLTERMRITAGGDVNIKGNNTKLGWERTSDGASNIAYLTKTQTISTNGEAKLHGYDGIIFTTEGAETEKMRITSAGKVGIGTTNPSYKLTVESDVSYGGILIEGNNAPGLSIIDHSSTSESKIYVQSTASSSGNLRISADNNNTATTPTIEFQIGGSEKMRITDGGNVGIGTTNPSEKLEVDGNVQIGSTTDAKLYMVSTGGNGNNERFFIEGYADGGTYGGGFKLSTRNDSNIFNTVVTVNRNGDVTMTGNVISAGTFTGTNFILSSDERLKENIEEVCDNRIKADWKTFELKTEKGQKRYGVIAQELEKTNPEFVREDTQGFKSVAYIDLLIAKIAELEARLEKAGI